jgi:hypothetical protein
MADISQTQTPAQTGPGIPDAALDRDQTFVPGGDAALEAELERAEKQLREDRDHRFMTEHPDGIGPTLGQDLGAPNLGSAAVDWNHEDYDPPT